MNAPTIDSGLTKGCVAELVAGQIPVNPIVKVLATQSYDHTMDEDLVEAFQLKKEIR